MFPGTFLNPTDFNIKLNREGLRAAFPPDGTGRLFTSCGDQPPAVSLPLACAGAQVISLPPPPRGSRALFFDLKSNRMYFYKFFSEEFISSFY